MGSPRILVFSSDPDARDRIEQSIARALDTQPVICATLDDVQNQTLRTRADVLVIDHLPNDSAGDTLWRWLTAAGIHEGVIHLSDHVPESARKGEFWLSRNVRGQVLGDVITRYLAATSQGTRKGGHAIDTFRVTLDDLERALDDMSSSVDVVRSLRDTHELLDALNLGPQTIEMTSVVVADDSPDEADVRAFITQLRALVDGRDPTQGRVMLFGRDERVSELKTLLEPNVTVSHVVHRESLEPACELLAPHVVAIFDESDRQTRDTLLLLRQILPGLRPTVAIIGRINRAVDRHLAYEVEMAFDADVSLAQAAEALTRSARRAAQNAPRVLLVDESSVLAPAMDAVERIGGRPIVLEDPSQVLNVIAEIALDAIILVPSYRRVSGFDVCRSIRGSFGSPIPILFLADHADQVTRTEAFRAGCDDVISLPWVAGEVQRRIRHLVELRRLRAEIAHRDQLTGCMHVSGFATGLRSILEATAHENAVSFAAFEVCDFADLRKKHGEHSAKTVLRHVADRLCLNFDENLVFRGWGERFFVISPTVLPEESTASPWAPVLDISRVTFRDASGRGFYASVNAAHLIAPSGKVTVNGCIEGLLRILSRCRALGSAQLMTARIDSSTEPISGGSSYGSNPERRWKPVVLTRDND